MAHPLSPAGARLRPGQASAPPARRHAGVPTIAWSGWAAHDGAPPERCPLCLASIVPMPGRAGLFRHQSALCDAACVLTTHAYQPAELIVRPSRDRRIFGEQRRRFVDQWPHHYAVMRQLCPCFTVARFLAVLGCADVLELWSYATLREQDVAMVLLALAGFMKLPDTDEAAEAGAKRARWVRFWFDGSVRDIGDLWAPREQAAALFRVDYREPVATPFPTGAQVLAWTPVDDVHELWVRRIALPAALVDATDRRAFERFIRTPLHTPHEASS